MKNKSFYSQLPKEILLLFAGEKLRNYFFEKDFSRIEAPTFEISQKDIEEYKKSVSKVNFWHGTGKFKYENGEIQDILTPVFEDGLKTHEDKYLSILSNDLIMNSISLVKSRKIARCYADIHRVENTEKPAYRAGNSAFWLSKYYAKMYFTMYTKYFFVGAVRVWGWRRRVKTNSKNSWSSKVNKKGRTTWDAFHKFSDIDGNFPIILGISKLEKPPNCQKCSAKSKFALLIIFRYSIFATSKCLLKKSKKFEIFCDTKIWSIFRFSLSRLAKKYFLSYYENRFDISCIKALNKII